MVLFHKSNIEYVFDSFWLSFYVSGCSCADEKINMLSIEIPLNTLSAICNDVYSPNEK